MAFEWVAGLFQSDNKQARGLSGDSANTVALDEANPYYNYRLRRHAAEGDLVADPGLLWYTSPYVKRRTGLGTHIAAEMGEGTANYTDVLLILSRADRARAGADWEAIVTRTLQQEFDNFCRRESFHRLHAHRPLGVRILEDGSPEMGNQTLQLREGEFVTGLLPNLYIGPVRGSYPVIGVHVNLPGVWEGYQEVGRLYNDQVLFTLGSHWLDNFQHDSLQEAALYRLRQYQDGSFVHIINPDLQDRYQVTSTNQGGASVLTLATRGGQPLAYIVLAVIDPPTSRPSLAPARHTPPPPPKMDRPDIKIPRAPTPVPIRERRADSVPDRRVPSIAPPMLLDEEIGGKLGGKTIIPDAPSERIFTLQERGALLQKVHFSTFMLGYDVYLGPRGELGTHVEDPAATFQVRKRSVSLVAHVDGVQVGGRLVPAGVEVAIEGDVRIEVAGQKLEYQDLRGLQVDGWPYVGEIRRPASSTYMIWGEDYQIGRSRECRVVLPDEPRNDNIHWKPSLGDGATIRSRSGEIPKSKFYTDSIMVASEHASIDLRKEQPTLLCTANNCYIYARRNSEVMPLYPAGNPQQPKSIALEPGDEVLIGNCLFHVGFTPATDAVAPHQAAPQIAFDTDALTDAVGGPDVLALDRESPSAAPPRDVLPPPPDELDAPAPGDRATPPTPPSHPIAMDSILHDADAPLNSPLADLDAEPTVLGVAQPRADGGMEWHIAAPPAALPARHDTDASMDEDDRDLLGWELDDWSEEDSSTGPPTDHDHVPEEPPSEVPSEVPPPFPDVAAVGRQGTETFDIADRVEPRTVVAVEDADARFELARPLHVLLAGWTVNGEVVCGNHTGADLVIPESRIRKDQSFVARDYFRLQVRGKKGSLEVIASSEVRVDEAEPSKGPLHDPEAHTIDVVRRDDQGDADFAVRLKLVEEKRLPDPRARFLSLDHSDPLVAALVTRGLPKGTPRRIDLGGVKMTLRWDGTTVMVSEYLDTYKRGDAFHPFFVQLGGGRFKTAPEDGASFELHPDDRMVVGHCVYQLCEE